MKKRLSMGLLAGVFALSSPNAHASSDASISVSISNLRLDLLDLAPSDGIAPSAKFGPGSAVSSDVTATDINTSASPVYAYSNRANDGLFGTLDNELNSGTAVARAALGGNLLGKGATLSIEASQTDGNSFAQAQVTVSQTSITLAPGSGLHLSGTMTIGTSGADALDLTGSFADFYLYNRDASILVDWNSLEPIPASNASTNSRSFTLELDNTGSSSMNVYFGGFVSAAVVPEPAVVTLMTGGLLALGSLARRQRAART